MNNVISHSIYFMNKALRGKMTVSKNYRKILKHSNQSVQLIWRRHQIMVLQGKERCFLSMRSTLPPPLCLKQQHRHCINSQQEGLITNAELPVLMVHIKAKGGCKLPIQGNAKNEGSLLLVYGNLEKLSSQEGVNLLFYLHF